MSRNARVLRSGVCEVTQEYKGAQHSAIDIVKGGYQLDDIVAHSDGKIIGLQDGLGNMKGTNSYGNYVKIQHDNGYCTLYAHMQKGLSVSNGQAVSKGQKLGYMGDSGNAYGGHLHFEVWNGNNRIDPTPYLDSDLPKKEITKSVDELAKEVIEGKYGNGEDRKRALGNRYAEVQARVNEMLSSNNVKYLHNPNYKGASIVDGLNQIGVDSSFNYRSKLANANGISNYSGTASQNTQMLEMLKKGTLKAV